LTDSGRFIYKVVKQPSIIAQNRKSLPARSNVLTTMLRHQLTNCVLNVDICFFSCERGLFFSGGVFGHREVVTRPRTLASGYTALHRFNRWWLLHLLFSTIILTNSG